MLAEPYSEALEQQVRLLRFVRSPQGIEQIAQVWGHVVPVRSANLGPLQDGLLATLVEAEPFYWAPPICQLLQAGVDMPLDFRLEASAVPSSAAFFWMGVPIHHDVDSASPWEYSIRAISWAVDTTLRTRDAPAVTFVVHWQWLSEEQFLAPYLMSPWPLGASLGETLAQWSSIADDHMHAARDYGLRLFAASMAFLQQPFLSSAARLAARPTRRRLARERWPHEPLVRVVELRRRAQPFRSPDTAEPVDWSCQWVVRGHWRQQWCPKAQAHQPRWILPYVKGPESKPLKPPRATVFAVVR